MALDSGTHKACSPKLGPLCLKEKLAYPEGASAELGYFGRQMLLVSSVFDVF